MAASATASYGIHKTFRKLDLWPWPRNSKLPEIFSSCTVVSISKSYRASFSSYRTHKLGCPRCPPTQQGVQKRPHRNIRHLFLDADRLTDRITMSISHEVESCLRNKGDGSKWDEKQRRERKWNKTGQFHPKIATICNSAPATTVV